MSDNFSEITEIMNKLVLRKKELEKVIVDGDELAKINQVLSIDITPTPAESESDAVH